MERPTTFAAVGNGPRRASAPAAVRTAEHAWCMGIGATKTTHAKRARANTQQAQLALSVLPPCGSNSEGGCFAQRMRMPQCRARLTSGWTICNTSKSF